MHGLRQTVDGPVDQKQRCRARWVLRLSAPRRLPVSATQGLWAGATPSVEE